MAARASSPLSALGAVTCVLSLVALGRAPSSTERLADEAPTPRPAAVVPSGPIDVNHASLEDLDRLPRIGPALAQRIIDGRPYERIEDLERVPGIGPRTIARLRDRVVVTPDRPTPHAAPADVEP